MLDNIANLLLTVGLLAGVYGFPASFALRYMIPGTAIGVLVGDLLYFWMAFRLARQTGNRHVTAMPLGLDTPSTFGMVFFVLGPAFQAKAHLPPDQAAEYAWHIGICSIFLSGLFKFACALGSNWVRRATPRAGLLGSLTAVALVLICFLPLLEILQLPIVGMVSLAIILTSLVARVPCPGRVPGALAGLLVGSAIYYLMQWGGMLDREPSGIDPRQALLPYEWLTVFHFQWVRALGDAVHYLPIVIPFALATVVGGIDCTESAAAAGDEYATGHVIAVEALATLVGSLCGGVIQSTPYIGHPAYKAMGGRAAYALATALFVGSAGLLGYFGYLYAIVPKVTVFPILVFVGLEITAQSFQATPRRHYAALALACVPVLAALTMIPLDSLAGEVAARGVPVGSLSRGLQQQVNTLRVLGSGFIVTSLLWGSALAAIIDRRLAVAAACFALAGVFALFGIIHSPLPGSAIFLPWTLELPARSTPYGLGAGYLAMAALLGLWQVWRSVRGEVHQIPEEELH